MSFIQELTKKPWTVEGAIEDRDDHGRFLLPKLSVGIRVLLVVMTVLFSLLVVSYADRMSLPDWRPLPEPWLLWLNTVVLIASSIAFQWASVSARRGAMDGVRSGLLASGILAFGFLVGQLIAWLQLVASGYYAAANPANAFFYLVTALHALHLFGGLVAWGRTTAKVRRGSTPAQLRLTVELCALYWHFLLVVWLVLFSLLLFT